MPPDWPPGRRTGPEVTTPQARPNVKATGKAPDASTVQPAAVTGRRCHQCAGPLPPRRRRFCSDDCRRRGQRAERVTETGDFGAAAVRMIRTMASRVGASDIAEFGAMWEVMTEAEHAVTEAIDDLRVSGFSWAEIGAEVGWSKQRLSQWRQRRGEFARQQSVYAGTPESGAAG
jgi:predicted nucleic acid-binding Zn ribbon protein